MDGDNILHIKTEKGTNKTLKIIAKHLHNNGALSHIVVYIYMILLMRILRKKIIFYQIDY